MIFTSFKMAISQTYHPLVDNLDKIWEVYSDNDAMGNPYSFYIDSIKFVSDTIIGTNNYKKCIEFHKDHNQYSGWSYNQYFFYLREDSSKKVYQWETNGDYLLYDFSLQLNDTFITYNTRTDTANSVANYWHITNIDSILIGSENRKRFILTSIKVVFPNGDTQLWTYNTDYWIEGIGSTSGLLDIIFPGTTGWAGEELTCYFENGISIYNANTYVNLNPITQAFFTGDCLTTITKTSIQNLENYCVHYDKGSLFVTLPDAKDYLIYIYNTFSKNILTQHIEGTAQIDLKNKNNNGLLLYKLTKGNELIKTGKIILINE